MVGVTITTAVWLVAPALIVIGPLSSVRLIPAFAGRAVSVTLNVVDAVILPLKSVPVTVTG